MSHATPGREFATNPCSDGAAESRADTGPMNGARTVALYTPRSGSESDPDGFPSSFTGAETQPASHADARSTNAMTRLARIAPIISGPPRAGGTRPFTYTRALQGC